MKIQKAVIQMALVLFVLCCLHSEVAALVIFDKNYNFNFRFNNPGARANAMGGAFIGLADDATAAYTNPAGLTILKQSEISLEYKEADHENTEYSPTEETYDFDETGSGFSFVSLVFPRERATFAVYRHQLIKITSDYTLQPRAYTAETDIEAVTYGIGAGLELLPNRLSLGFSAGFSQLYYYYTSEIYLDLAMTYPPMRKYLVDEEDTAEHYTLSLLWSPVGGLKLGLVYRQGPEFKTTMETFNNTDLVGGSFESSELAKNTLKVPDVYGLGLSYQFESGLTITADANRILYSDLAQDLVFRDGQTEYVGLLASDYTVDDRTEFHMGSEYVLNLDKAWIALRGGYYRKPEHRIRYIGTDTNQRNIAHEGKDDTIYSYGAGVAWGNMQIDAAASKGKYEQEYTLSFVYRFD
jgi:long-subunit fatty acid transport protein